MVKKCGTSPYTAKPLNSYPISRVTHANMKMAIFFLIFETIRRQITEIHS